MRPVEICKDVFWTGVVDWNSRDFHGYALSPRGTTYNAYLVKDEKLTLFDTVSANHAGELICAISHLAKPEDVDYLVLNHLEPDHAGALPRIVEACKPEKIFCSPMGLKAMKTYFHDAVDAWPVQTVKTGDSISLGRREVHFVETRMLHWPDSMVSYLPQDKLLISQDAFGQNIASSERFVDQMNRHAVHRAMQEYYANIVLPYSPVVLKTLDQIATLGLEIDIVAPDHGLIFRTPEDVQFVFDSYREFAEQKPRNKAVIVYDTMWRSTASMAEAIASALESEGVEVKLMWLKANHHSAVMTEVLDAAAVIVGSPTHNNGVLPFVAEVLQYMTGLRPQNKIGASFGSFGWSGESVKVIAEHLQKMNMELPAEPVKCQNKPTHADLARCVELGKTLAQAIQAKTVA